MEDIVCEKKLTRFLGFYQFLTCSLMPLRRGSYTFFSKERFSCITFLYFCPFYFAFIEIGTTFKVLFSRNKPSGFERMVHALRAILIFCVFFTLKDFSYHRDVAVHMALGWLILKILSLILFWRPWRESEFPKTKRHPLAGIAMSVLFGFALLALIIFGTFF